MGFIWTGVSRFVLPSSFRWRGTTYRLKSPNHKTDQGSFRGVILDDEYGLEDLAFKPQRIVDIGANIGIFSLWAGANFPAAQIHAYEPNSALKPYLDANLSQIYARVFPDGLCEKDGHGSLESSGHSQLGRCKADVSGDISVVTLRTAIRRMGGCVDLLKLDCEGAEWCILEDPEALQSVRSVRMEYHAIEEGHSVKRLVQGFKSMGFRASKLSGNERFGLAWFDRC
jgi:FkbM family methyltransferase